MKKETREALKASIRKYEGALEGEEFGLGRCACPLCQLFNTVWVAASEACGGCPVMAKTGKQGCG